MASELLIRIVGEPSVVEARQKGRALASELGMSAIDLTLVATAISEIARNMLEYAGNGEILLSIVEREARRGVHVEARDQGPGIADVSKAMQDGYSTGRGLGLGLPGAKRLMDEFDIRSQVGLGTTITMTKWAR